MRMTSRRSPAQVTRSLCLSSPSSEITDRPSRLSRVVIGVPHTFSTSQRNATRRAAERAGFTEIHLMVESTAAALGYGLLCAGSKNILVVDIGGGTTDVTITSIRDHLLTLPPSADRTSSSPTLSTSASPGGVEVTVMATAGHSQVYTLPAPLPLPWF
jgi:hypothetical protein